MDTPGKTTTLTKSRKIDSLPVASTLDGTDTGSLGERQELNREGTSFWKPFILDQDLGEERKDWYPKIHNLLLNLDEISDLFDHELHHQSWLNVFLLAAGMNQITEDYLSSTGFLGKAANVVKLLPRPFGSILSHLGDRLLRIWMNLKHFTPVYSRINTWEKRVQSLTGELAELVINSIPLEQGAADHFILQGEAILSEVNHLPKDLRIEIIRLPSCFLSFDQQIEDLQRIIRDFATKWPDRDRLITVVGIRTSGSYLGPLYTAVLKSQGYNNVSLETFRPGKTISGTSSLASKRLADENGLVLICDDPPISGATISKTAKMLEATGIPFSNIILLMQLFGDESSTPGMLAKYPAIIFTKQNWTIQQYLAPNYVGQVLSGVCTDFISISEVEQIPNGNIEEDRQHVHAQYNVKMVNNENGEVSSRTIQVKGIGLGYYAEHTLAVSQLLSSYSARIITVQNGLIYLDLGPDAKPLSKQQVVEDDRWTESIIKYIHDRSKKLTMREDVSLKIYGRNAVWEVASNIISKVFPSSWWLARLAFIDQYVKKVLTPSRASVIDGDIGLSNWYFEKSRIDPLFKVHLTERDFSHKDLFSYDPVFDLAGLAQEVGEFHLAKNVRQAFEALTDEPISSERWMLYQLVRLWDSNRQNIAASDSIGMKMARVVQEYYSDIYFSDLNQPTSGPICALDVDGVLETNQLGFASLTESSAESLRALIQHGYRIILATGRSLNEVKNRCEAYHLAGGVAEYGSVLYDTNSKEELSLVTEKEQLAMAQLRSSLTKIQGISIDTDYQYSIRAYCLDRFSKRRGLSDETISEVLKASESLVQVMVVKGDAQTDFVLSRINKAVGIELWLSKYDQKIGEVSVGDNNPIALAVGDSRSDIQMLTIASHAFAPAHANLGDTHASVYITQKPYQSGFEQAVTSFLSHKPGTCPTCLPITPHPETQFMLDLLSVQEDGLANMIKQVISLSVRKVTDFNVGSH